MCSLQMERLTEMTKLIVAFCSSANASNISFRYMKGGLGSGLFVNQWHMVAQIRQ